MNARRSTRLRPLFRFAWLIGGVLSLAACFGGGGDNAPVVQPAVFRNLGFLPGYASSSASAVSSDGSVVVGVATTAANNRQAFRWNSREGMVGLGFMPGGTTSGARAVSADGATIVGDGNANSGDPSTSLAAFRWTADAGLQRLVPPPGPAISLCSAGGVSGDGAVVVGTCLQFNNAAFRWMASTGSVALSQFGGGSNQQSTAVAISRDGAVIAGAGHPVLTGAVIWATDGSPTILGKLPGHGSGTATAVSRDGSVVVGSSTDGAGNSRAFRWTRQTGMADLGNASDGLLASSASSVSGDGRIIVGTGTTATGDVALIWDADHGWRRLDAVLETHRGHRHFRRWAHDCRARHEPAGADRGLDRDATGLISRLAYTESSCDSSWPRLPCSLCPSRRPTPQRATLSRALTKPDLRARAKRASPRRGKRSRRWRSVALRAQFSTSGIGSR
jgi:probable HAF family extracellular repeat protein